MLAERTKIEFYVLLVAIWCFCARKRGDLDEKNQQVFSEEKWLCTKCTTYHMVRVVKCNRSDQNSTAGEMIFGVVNRCNVFNSIRFEYDKQR